MTGRLETTAERRKEMKEKNKSKTCFYDSSDYPPAWRIKTRGSIVARWVLAVSHNRWKKHTHNVT